MARATDNLKALVISQLIWLGVVVALSQMVACVASSKQPTQAAPTTQRASTSDQSAGDKLADFSDDERKTVAGDKNTAAQGKAKAVRADNESQVRISDGAAYVFWLAIAVVVVFLLVLLAIIWLTWETALRKGKMIERATPARVPVPDPAERS